MLPVEPYYIQRQGSITNTRRETTSSLWTCGQRKRVAHMSTATTTKDDSSSKMVQNRPLVCLKRPKILPLAARLGCRKCDEARRGLFKLRSYPKPYPRFTTATAGTELTTQPLLSIRALALGDRGFAV